MDTSIKAETPQPERIPIGWKCTADGKHYATFTQKRCSDCIPIYDEVELSKLLEAP